MQKIITYGLIWLLVIWAWVWVSFFMRSETTPTQAQLIQENLNKMYARQSEAQMKIIENEILKSKAESQIEYWTKEHNWTFEVIKDYKQQLLSTKK